MWHKTSKKKPRKFEFVLIAWDRDYFSQVGFYDGKGCWATDRYQPILEEPKFWMSFKDLPPLPIDT